jgi:hypothetical protein
LKQALRRIVLAPIFSSECMSLSFLSALLQSLWWSGVDLGVHVRRCSKWR